MMTARRSIAQLTPLLLAALLGPIGCGSSAAPRDGQPVGDGPPGPPKDGVPPAADSAGGDGANQKTRPSILVIMTDDQHVESLRVMTKLKALISEHGTMFENNFSTTSLCCPSRSTFLSGQYTHNHGVWSNRFPDGTSGYSHFDHKNTLAVWLRSAGYHTAHIGKYLNGYNETAGVPPGWSDWQGLVDPSTYNYYNYTINENGKLTNYGAAPAEYQTDVLMAKAEKYIRGRAQAKEPFFLWLATLAPHDDGTAPTGPEPAPRHIGAPVGDLPADPSFDEADVSDKPKYIQNMPRFTTQVSDEIHLRYKRRLRSLLAVDEGIEKLVQALEQTGQLSRTLIIFTSDNGFFHGEHRVPGGKILCYEVSIRVPLIVRLPGQTTAGSLPVLAGNIDLAPSIIDAAKGTAGRTMDGRTLLPVLQDPGQAWRTMLLNDGPKWSGYPEFSGLRTQKEVYVEYVTGEKEYYLLDADPHQLTNGASSPTNAARIGALAKDLAAMKTCAGPSCWK